jgi:hypothetical protein
MSGRATGDVTSCGMQSRSVKSVWEKGGCKGLSAEALEGKASIVMISSRKLDVRT